MKFQTTLELPSSRTVVSLTCMNNAMHEDLQKFILEGNDYLIIQYFDHIITTCIGRGIDNLDIVDKFVALCKIKSISYSSVLNLVTPDNSSFNINLDDIINLIQKWKIETPMIEIGETTIKLRPPKHFVFDNPQIAAIDTINGVQFRMLQAKKQEDILRYIDARTLVYMDEYISGIETAIGNTYFIPKIAALNISPLRLSPFNRSMYGALLTTFREDLLSSLKLKYTCLTNLGISLQDYLNLTPAEIKLFLSFYNEQNVKQQQQQETLKA